MLPFLIACTTQTSSPCDAGAVFYGQANLEGEEEVADFFSRYSSVEGELFVRDLLSSERLRGLCAVHGSLDIADAPLQELWGLEGLGEVQSLALRDLERLESLAGLAGISGTHTLVIEDVPSLPGLIGLAEELPLERLRLDLEGACSIEGLDLPEEMEEVTFSCRGEGSAGLGGLQRLQRVGQMVVGGNFGRIDLDLEEAEELLIYAEGEAVGRAGLRRVGELSLRVDGPSRVELPLLEVATSVSIVGDRLQGVDLAALGEANKVQAVSPVLQELRGLSRVKELEGGLYLEGPLTSQEAFPGLERASVVQIGGATWEDLPAFPSLRQIEYSLQLSDMPALRRMDGLGAATLGGLRLASVGLTDTRDVEGRLLDGGRVELLSNDGLVAAAVLGEISSASTIHIHENPLLEELDFAELVVLDRLEIDGNERLCRLELPKLEQVETVRILRNPCLSTSEILARLEGIQVTGELTVEENGP